MVVHGEGEAMSGLDSLSVGIINITDANASRFMWGDTEAEQAQYGTGHESYSWLRKHFANPAVYTRTRPMTTTELLRLRGQLFTQLVDIDKQIVESMKGKDYPCSANVDGNYLHLSEEAARLSYELPLIVRPATVIGD